LTESFFVVVIPPRILEYTLSTTLGGAGVSITAAPSAELLVIRQLSAQEQKQG